MPIATSLCPDEVDHHGNDAEDDADTDDEELKRWSSLVRQQHVFAGPLSTEARH